MERDVGGWLLLFAFVAVWIFLSIAFGFFVDNLPPPVIR